MSVRLLVCLVFVTKIVANDSTTSQYEATSKNKTYRQGNPRIIVTEGLNDVPDDGTSLNTTANKTNSTGNNTLVVPLIKEEDKNGTVTKKPDNNEEGMETQSSQIVHSYPPYDGYEVTENVIDIPDNRTLAGPIVPTYTVKPSLNLANGTINQGKPTRNHSKPCVNTKPGKDKVTEANKQTKTNRLSILHINAEFDDKKQEVHENKVIGLFKGIKEYIHNFQRSVVNGLHSLFHKHQDFHEHDEKFGRAEDWDSAESDEEETVDLNEYYLHQRH